MYTAKDYDKALLTPESIFSTPMEVVKTRSLTPEQKMAVLKRWEAQATQLEVADNESMVAPDPSHQNSHLREIGKAILALADRENIDDTAVIQIGSTLDIDEKSKG